MDDESSQAEAIVENAKPPPKKRGRKRKSEVLLRQIAEIEDVAPRVETVSRRGRPRKKVNYFELANPDNAEAPIEAEKQRNHSFGDEVKPKKRKVDENLELSASLTELKSTEEENSGNNSDTVFEEDHSRNGDVTTDINDLKDNSDDTISNEATTSTPSYGEKRYNYTGETVKMMNTLFTLFTATEPSQNNLPSPVNKSGKRPYNKTKNIEDREEDLDDGTGNVTCAVCNTKLEKSLWSHHKQRCHNNLAWRVGDKPLDLNDQSFVMHTLNLLYKKKKPLYCDKCGTVKKSVVGFLSHRSQCLKSDEQLESVKITCELCGRKMLPVSMNIHMKTIHQNPTPKSEIPKKIDDEKPLSSKRSAAKKALKMIESVSENNIQSTYISSNLNFDSQDFARNLLEKELKETEQIQCKFGCSCILNDLSEAVKHLNECTEKPQEGFLCKQCLAVYPKLEEMIKHIESIHDVVLEGSDDEEEYDGERPSYVEREISRLPSFLYTNVKKFEKVLCPFAFKWTQQFCTENFQNSLFEELRFSPNNWLLLNPQSASKYLPKMNQSCETARIHVTSIINGLDKNYTYKRFDLFKSEVEDNQTTVFCGGPITSLAWLPTPFDKPEENQILAISVLNSPDEKYSTYENKNLETAIQFWNFGPLVNKNYSLKEPQLVYGLAHNHGPVWHIEWCPSGCYNEDRMGLLATTGADGIVYVYALPYFNPDEMGLYFKAKPLMKLFLQRPGSPLLGGLKYYPSKISWSKASGHQYISVGYTNGFVALFNIKTTSCILKFIDSEKVHCFLPSKCFQAHLHTITVLALYHLNEGCRWLLTGSSDKKVNIWDLENPSYPICSTKKGLMTDGFWFTNWPCYVTSYDEGSASQIVNTVLKQVRDFENVKDPHISPTYATSTIATVAGSDFLNGIIHGSTAGEIIGIFPHQILYTFDMTKCYRAKRMLFGYTRLIDKTKTPEQRIKENKIKKEFHLKKDSARLMRPKAPSADDYVFIDEPVIYDEADKKYALVFCDNKMDKFNDFPKETTRQIAALSKCFDTVPPNQYPLSSINKIVFNPNRQASLYFATGYQAGFLRVSWLKFLKDDFQIK